MPMPGPDPMLRNVFMGQFPVCAALYLCFCKTANNRASLQVTHASGASIMAYEGFDDLVAFAAVADTGSFKAAGRQLGRDASVIS
jgi:hypothetical protein